MPREARMLYLHALTPVHSGTGQAVAVIDLPIAREKATGWPHLPGSAVKGVFRDLMRGTRKDDDPWVQHVFGKADGAGDLCFADQRLLLLAVRSFFGTFAYVTSPLVLTRLCRDIVAVGGPATLPTLARAPTGMQVMVADNTVLVHGDRVYLEDLDLTRTLPGAQEIAAALSEALFAAKEERDAFTARFALVGDDLFSFLCETATEVTARVRLKDDSKTVAKGGLWYEEAVPAESVFAGPVLIERTKATAPTAAAALAQHDRTCVQIGGDASVGRGLCRISVGGGHAG